MKHRESGNVNRITERQIQKKKNLSSYAQITWYDIFAKGDPTKERKLALLQLRIVHILCLATIPAAIIGLIFILASGNAATDTSTSGVIIAAVIFYLVSFLMIFLGYKWSKTPKWLSMISIIGLLIESYSTSKYYHYLVLLMNHIFRILFCFEIVVLFGFILGMISNNLYSTIPLFILATIALAMTYPTNMRFEQWLSKQEIT